MKTNISEVGAEVLRWKQIQVYGRKTLQAPVVQVSYANVPRVLSHIASPQTLGRIVWCDKPKQWQCGEATVVGVVIQSYHESNFFLCFGFIFAILHKNQLKEKKIAPRMKVNHNIGEQQVVQWW